ncbi:hypothetical protein QWY85_13600 [Neolewinella lacunae]|uniref:Uncharacterized protein n=1 Tax=Neolewinella lacunae TaxID=1517758 RepID=A0A923PFR1_9BACT|nr:hypothetical protein [Neolewinella lacunae]MBC6993255.1 hypothetical protein [Neolewinella lacunae]MDN3635698.1 hypothetical protein [Neolewinella lacunae]
MQPINPAIAPHPAEDYAGMRAEGFAAIERLAHQRWTDYNAHDPGITLLENLLYALAETGYRGQFDLADLLTGPGGAIDHRQPFFTARRILTGAPLTNDDFRRLLIDSLGLSNAWAICKQCACGPLLFAECKDGELSTAPRWRLALDPSNRREEHPVRIQGFTDFLLQFATDQEYGNLNSHRLDGTLVYPLPAGEFLSIPAELRFPDWRQLSESAYREVSASTTVLEGLTIERFSRDRTLLEPVDADDFRRGVRDIFFLDVTLRLRTGDGALIQLLLTEITLRVWLGAEDAALIDPPTLEALLGQSDLFARYLGKLQRREGILATSQRLLHDNRRVGEDYCRVDGIRAEDVAVCADLHLTPGADVEQTLALVYYTLESLLNPLVPFRTLAELESLGIPTEAIFTGPPLQQGFLLQEDLDAAQLRSVVYVSDLVNALMDLPGVSTLEALRFTVYDADGRPLAPAHPWCIPVSPGHYPALYLAASQVMVYKDGLPLLPRRAELRSVLAQLRAADRAVALPTEQLDYPVPTGKHRPAPEYLPVQRTLPTIYGLSEEGLGADAGAGRRAKARQLAGYLFPFEQIVATTAQQLAGFGDLFSTDEAVAATYPHPSLAGAGEPLGHLAELLTPAATPAALRDLLEPAGRFADRRNRFLDHLLARFGESIANYSLLIHDQSTRRAYGPEKLIQDKVRFLRFYPEISGRRGTGINYTRAEGVCAYRNRSGLGERIRRLLGMEDARAYFSLETERIEGGWKSGFVVTAPAPNLSMAPALRRPSGESTDPPGIYGATAEEAEARAWEVVRELIELAPDPANYAGDELHNAAGEALATLGAGVTQQEVADFFSAALARERLYVVEHILLRPKFPGDALLSVCLAENCEHWGMEDPYSFRITYVLPADVEPFSQDMELRRYADRLIRRETPAHLLPKLCWVSDAKAESEYSPEELAELAEQCRCPVPDALARQLSRFEAVYCAYLERNKDFAWTALNDELSSAVLDLLPPAATPTTAHLLLGYYGENFRRFLADVARSNETLPPAASADWADSVWDDLVDDLVLIQQNDPAFYGQTGMEDAARRADFRQTVESFYGDWLDVSFRLHRLLLVFEQLRSAYPEATLHDCDDGDDDQPVRLDQTTLGTL